MNKTISNSESSIQSFKYLDWRDRPENVKKQIDSAFNSIKYNECSQWGVFNGNSDYGILGIDVCALIEKIIVSAPKEKKDFYVLDIGAGNFQSCDYIANCFKDKQILEGKRLHVFGIRGEGGSDSIEESGHCQIYKLTAFKVENLYEELAKRNYPNENIFDVVETNWCMRHLSDPVGAFVQAFDATNPEGGFFLTDGFFYGLDANSANTDAANLYFYLLLLNTKAPFLVQHWNDNRSLDRCVLKRANKTPCQLSMCYKDIQIESRFRDFYQIGSGAITLFESHYAKSQGKITSNENRWFQMNGKHDSSRYLHGDFSLFNWLQENKLINKDAEWVDFTYKRTTSNENN